MDKCFVACGCDDHEGVTKSDLDRFTDKIENVLNDEKGRRLFRNFLYTTKKNDGRRTLDFIEHIDRLLIYPDDAKSTSYRSYLKDFDQLIEEAERIEELDFATMERLVIARDSENKNNMVHELKLLKVEAVKALRKEYNDFRQHFIPTK